VRSNIDQLTDIIAQRAGISPSQARIAIIAVLQFLTARLPSPIVGQIKALLENEKLPDELDLRL
jgi:hypothetical protein